MHSNHSDNTKKKKPEKYPGWKLCIHPRVWDEFQNVMIHENDEPFSIFLSMDQMRLSGAIWRKWAKKTTTWIFLLMESVSSHTTRTEVSLLSPRSIKFILSQVIFGIFEFCCITSKMKCRVYLFQLEGTSYLHLWHNMPRNFDHWHRFRMTQIGFATFITIATIWWQYDTKSVVMASKWSTDGQGSYVSMVFSYFTL